jgi:Ni/Co efflux regulator RcnB
MKKLLIPVFALGLAATMPTMLWAQDDHHDQTGDHPMAGQADGSKPDDANKDKTGPDNTGAGDKHPDATGGDAAMKDKSTTKTRMRHHRRTTTNTTNKNTTNVTTRNVHRTNVDITTYRKTIVSTRHYNAGAYRAPPGYSYRRYGIGERLPPAFFVQDYWLTDYASYGLIAPPGDGYVWVRFGPDALLIDESDGETIQVVYGVFA